MVRSAWIGLVGLAVMSGCVSAEREALDRSHVSLIAQAEKASRAADYVAAVRHLEKAAQLKPGDVDTQFLLGNALAARAQAPDLAGVDPQVRAAFLTRALEHHRKALEMRPRSAPARYKVGEDLILLGRSAEAVAYLEQAQERDPKMPLIDARLGDAHRLLGHYDLALAAYQAGLAKSREPLPTAELREGLGELYAAQGKIAEALREFAAARDIVPSASRRKRIEQRIESLTPAPTTRP